MKSLSVLLVEDNTPNQVVVRKMLKRLGHACTVAASGSEGIELARNECFDLILMDMGLPDMNGFDTISSIRGNEPKDRLKSALIILLTAPPEKSMGPVERQIDGYLSKPFTIAALEEQIFECLDKPRHTHPEASAL